MDSAEPLPVRIAMWSGPRTLSTALLRAWGSREDTAVVDEPFYAFYLASTGKDHPGREEVISAGETDPERVVADLLGAVPGGKPIFFQKHMAHHLLPEVDRAWLEEVRSAFLIRDPREMLLSLADVLPTPGLEDTGLPQLRLLFEEERERLGRDPPVVLASDLQKHPEAMLRRLCGALGVDFDPAMLRWAPGSRPTDGAWAGHWYGSVERSAGFRPARPRTESLPEDLVPIHLACLAHHEVLHEARLRPGRGG